VLGSSSSATATTERLPAGWAVPPAQEPSRQHPPGWVWPVVAGLALVVGLLGGVLGALYPALKAARLDAVEALSYE